MHKSKIKKKEWMLSFLVILAPFIIALLLVLLQAIKRGAMQLPIPAWNDEGAYFALVKTFLATGQPIGYWGFNGGHAIIGTGSGWSTAILLPYAIFGWIFSWGYSSVFLANVSFLIGAHAIFLTLTKPKKEKLIRVLILEFTSMISILYMTTSMSEPLRFSLVIILAGMFYRLYWTKSSRFFQYILLPIYIIAITQVYIFLVFCVPIYIFGISRNKSFWKKLLYSLGAMSILSGISYYVLHLISSNYNIYKTEKLFSCIKNLDFLGAVVEFSRNVKDGIVTLLSICNAYVGHGLFLWFVPLCLLFVVIPFALWIWSMNKKKGNKKTDVIIYAMVAYSVGLFLFMYISVYSLERFTFFRGVGIVILFAMYLLIFLENRKIYLFFACIYGLGILFLPSNLTDFNIERYPTKQTLREWTSLSEKFEEVLVLNTSENPWENTVAVYTLEPRVLTAIPEGFGVNMMMDSSIFASEARYILLPIKESEELRSDWLETDYQEFLAEFERNMKEYILLYDASNIRIYQKEN